jgi:hypothetical protein
VEGVYVDPEEYEPQIGEALQAVATEVDRIINPPDGALTYPTRD